MPASYNNNCENDIKAIKGATFLVRINFRQNASWQGVVYWLEGKKTVAFRSSEELAVLLLEAAQECENNNERKFKLSDWEKAQDSSCVRLSGGKANEVGE